jgi:catalase (peroxidase I)
VKEKHPELSVADIWAFAGCSAVEFVGGPKVPISFGRTDAPNGSYCPPNGLLPDASQGAAHLRDVFYRMGFDDRGIVCLSGAHTLGRCHMVRSGFDGPWTRNPLKFDNHYFKNLIHLQWKPKQWDGPFQYEDESGDLMMLPTDLALIQDEKFRPFVEMYAKDEALFFRDFAQDFGQLVGNSLTPATVAPLSTQQQASADFREAAMHGSLPVVKKLASVADVHEVEANSGRTALHKAAFWGHDGTIEFLLSAKLNPNVQDYNGDTALHDAARFGHTKVVELLLNSTDRTLRNKEGRTPVEVAGQYAQDAIVALLSEAEKSKL